MAPKPLSGNNQTSSTMDCFFLCVAFTLQSCENLDGPLNLAKSLIDNGIPGGVGQTPAPDIAALRFL
jgi:hypothetical protein